MIYDQLARWWPLLSAPADYEEEAGIYVAALRSTVDGSLETLLELGSGGGNNASHLRSDLRLTLVDLSEEMLEVSRDLNPGCEHVCGDMRTVRLGRTFDAILIHDAIQYMTTADDLRAAIETAWAHCRPGGVALFVPDDTRETFRPTTDHGGHDADDGRGLRYLEWTWDPDPEDTTIQVDYAILLRGADGSCESVHDTHVRGLFRRATWEALIEAAGFEPRTVPYRHSDFDPEAGRELFLGVRPPA